MSLIDRSILGHYNGVRKAGKARSAMAFELPLPDDLAGAGWKVKIYDRERLEPPHVTIVRGTLSWRFDLRAMSFMDKQPPPRKVDRRIVQVLEDNRDQLCSEWDSMYPSNPVQAPEGDDDA